MGKTNFVSSMAVPYQRDGTTCFRKPEVSATNGREYQRQNSNGSNSSLNGNNNSTYTIPSTRATLQRSNSKDETDKKDHKNRDSFMRKSQ